MSTLAIGQGGKVMRIEGKGPAYQRLLEMGLTVGTTVEVVHFAPLGDPIDIRVRGYHLSLRKSEAETILVQIA